MRARCLQVETRSLLVVRGGNSDGRLPSRGGRLTTSSCMPPLQVTSWCVPPPLPTSLRTRLIPQCSPQAHASATRVYLRKGRGEERVAKVSSSSFTLALRRNLTLPIARSRLQLADSPDM